MKTYLITNEKFEIGEATFRELQDQTERLETKIELIGNEIHCDKEIIGRELDIEALCDAIPDSLFQDSYGHGVAVVNNVSYNNYSEIAEKYELNIEDYIL